MEKAGQAQDKKKSAGRYPEKAAADRTPAGKKGENR